MKVVDIEGVGPAVAERLAAAGARTTDALLKRGSTPKGRKDLAAAAGIDEKKILEWVNHCDLMRVRGVGPEFSDLLEAAGVDTVKELGTRRPDNLHAKLAEVNSQKKLVRRVPTAVEVEAWVNHAKTLAPGVTY